MTAERLLITMRTSGRQVTYDQASDKWTNYMYSGTRTNDWQHTYAAHLQCCHVTRDVTDERHTAQHCHVTTRELYKHDVLWNRVGDIRTILVISLSAAQHFAFRMYVRLSVCPFVRHACVSRLNGSGYRIRFAQYDGGMFPVSGNQT